MVELRKLLLLSKEFTDCFCATSSAKLKEYYRAKPVLFQKYLPIIRDLILIAGSGDQTSQDLFWSADGSLVG